MGREQILPRYVVAFASVIATLVLRQLLDPVLQNATPFMLSTLAVMLSGWYGGLGPGLFATALGALAGTLLFLLEPSFSLRIPSVQQGMQLTLFALVGVVISWLNGALHASRQRAEQSASDAAAARERSESILASISDAFIAVSPDWRLMYVNLKAVELARKSREKLVGETLWEVFPETESFHSQLESVMKERIPVHFEEFFPGFDAWFGIDAYPSKEGLSVFARDVTERRRIEEQLRQTQKLDSLGVLAGGVAHDFSNLLTAIIGNASVALESLPAAVPLRQCLEDVLGASEKAAALTKQMLAYSGKGRFMLHDIDLSRLLLGMHPLMQSFLPKHVNLRLELADSLPVFRGDPGEIQQLVMSLVANAAEALEQSATGQILIRTGFENVDQSYIQNLVAPTEVSPGMHVRLEVHDTGCGMNLETQAKLFDPFFTTKSTGRGLGLAAVLGIVRGNRGGVKVYSHPGEGSVFKLIFPAAAKQEQPDASAIAAPLSGKGAVLCVDHEEPVRKGARAVLESCGYSVLLARNGDQAVEVFENVSRRISLVLLEIGMPLVSAAETIARLKRIRPDVPIVASSGYSEDVAVGRIGQELAGFLDKPYTAAQLTAKIAKVLTSSPAGR